MDPLLIAALISGGGSLLGGLLSGAQKAAERKRGKEDYWELLKKRLDLIKGEFKPKTERYAIEKHLPQWDEFMKKALMGSYAEAFGQKGVDMPSAADYLAQMFAGFGEPGYRGMGEAVGMGSRGRGTISPTSAMPGAMQNMANRRFLGQDIGRGMMKGFGGSYA